LKKRFSNAPALNSRRRDNPKKETKQREKRNDKRSFEMSNVSEKQESKETK
jgi:hypothetical protein